MTLRLIIGIDPGVNGAIALMADGEPSTVYDMPTMDRETGGRSIHAPALSDLLSRIVMAYVGSHVHAVLEPPSTRRGESPTNALKMGEGYGILKGILASYGVHWTECRPQVWKKHQGLIGLDKTASRQLALSKWPGHGIHFSRVKDHDRAEAMLMAQWGNETECWTEKSAKKRAVKKSKRVAA